MEDHLSTNPAFFERLDDEEIKVRTYEKEHYFHGFVCETDTRGYVLPDGKSLLELVVDTSKGFIPLWDENVTLNWRFEEKSLAAFRDKLAVQSYVKGLLGEALLLWGPAVPVRFSETTDPWDFEIVFSQEDKCSINGCSLARAFFPDAGQHNLVLYPKMFLETRSEQVETMAHELGHIFGLRHFFANVSEQAFPSEIFGEHSKFSIMSYGNNSQMTENDINDLINLYRLVWSGHLKEINGTRIKLFRPFSSYAGYRNP